MGKITSVDESFCQIASGKRAELKIECRGIMRRVMRRSSRPPESRRVPPAANAAVDARAQRTAAILAVVRKVPHGRVTTYGAVAARAGLPRQARLVGKVLAGLPDDTGVPWQRVVAAGGRIALPLGSSARERQVARLRAERVDASRGRVDLARHGWDAAVGELDQLLWSGE